MKLLESAFLKPTLVESDITKLPKGVLRRITYPICNIGVKNHNGRKYEAKVWDNVEADKDIVEKIAHRTLYGHAEHPKDDTQSNLEKTSHIITKLYRANDLHEGKQILKEFAVVDLVNTPYGQIINALFEAGCDVGVSTRADGDVEEAIDESGEPYKNVIADSYKFRALDFTADPSTFAPYAVKMESNIVHAVQAGVGEKKMSKEYGLAMLESFNGTEAKEVKRRINECDGKCAHKCNMVLDGKCACGGAKSESKEQVAAYFSQPDNERYFRNEVDRVGNNPLEEQYHDLAASMVNYAKKHGKELIEKDVYAAIPGLLSKCGLSMDEGKVKEKLDDKTLNKLKMQQFIKDLKNEVPEAWGHVSIDLNTDGGKNTKAVFDELGLSLPDTKENAVAVLRFKLLDKEGSRFTTSDLNAAIRELYPDKDYHMLNSTEQANVAIKAHQIALKKAGKNEGKVNEMYEVPADKRQEALSKLRTALKSNSVVGTPAAKIINQIIRNVEKDNFVSLLDIDTFTHHTGIKADQLKRLGDKANECVAPDTKLQDELINAKKGKQEFVVKFYPSNEIKSFKNKEELIPAVAAHDGNVIVIVVGRNNDEQDTPVYYGDAKLFHIKDREVKEKRILESDYRDKSDEDIEAEFADFKIQSIKINHAPDADGTTSGFIVLEFPNAGDSVAGGQEGPAEVSDSWILYGHNNKIAFDNWYPEKTYIQLVNAIRDEVDAYGKKQNKNEATEKTYRIDELPEPVRIQAIDYYQDDIIGEESDYKSEQEYEDAATDDNIIKRMNEEGWLFNDKGELVTVKGMPANESITEKIKFEPDQMPWFAALLDDGDVIDVKFIGIGEKGDFAPSEVDAKFEQLKKDDPSFTMRRGWALTSPTDAGEVDMQHGRNGRIMKSEYKKIGYTGDVDESVEKESINDDVVKVKFILKEVFGDKEIKTRKTANGWEVHVHGQPADDEALRVAKDKLDPYLKTIKNVSIGGKQTEDGKSSFLMVTLTESWDVKETFDLSDIGAAVNEQQQGRTYTKVGEEQGYSKEDIDKAIAAVKWEPFRTEGLPFMQGEAIKGVVKATGIPVRTPKGLGIKRMALHGGITSQKQKDEGEGQSGFYALDVQYSNGMAQIYIADDGVHTVVVASDFQPNIKTSTVEGTNTNLLDRIVTLIKKELPNLTDDEARALAVRLETTVTQGYAEWKKSKLSSIDAKTDQSAPEKMEGKENESSVIIKFIPEDDFPYKAYDKKGKLLYQGKTRSETLIRGQQELKNANEAKAFVTKSDYVIYLNEVGIPDDDKKSNGGRIPDNAEYGEWLRRNDPIAFNVKFHSIKRRGHANEANIHAVGMKVMVSKDGTNSMPAEITETSSRTGEKATHGHYWKDHNAYLVKYANETTEYVPADMVKLVEAEQTNNPSTAEAGNLLVANKDMVAEQLEAWAETFGAGEMFGDDDSEEDAKLSDEAGDKIWGLAQKLKQGKKLNAKNIAFMVFHLRQAFYDPSDMDEKLDNDKDREAMKAILATDVGPLKEGRKFDLSSGHLGNGITVWDRAKEEHGDYEKIAHIDADRKIKWYLKNPPADVIKYVEDIAKGKNPSISATQPDQKVFRENKVLHAKPRPVREGIKDIGSEAVSFTKDDMKALYALLYKLENHFENYAEKTGDRKLEGVVTQIIQILSAVGVRESKVAHKPEPATMGIKESVINEISFESYLAQFERMFSAASADIKKKFIERIGKDIVVPVNSLTEAKTTSATLQEMVKVKEQRHIKAIADLNKVHAAEVKTLSESVSLAKQEITQLIEKQKRDLIEKYVTLTVGHSGLKLNENALTLLKQCVSEAEVDEMLGNMHRALSENALHFKADSLMIDEHTPVDPEVARIVHNVSKAFEGINQK